MVLPELELAALRAAMQETEQAQVRLGLIKRGYQHLWNEIAHKYGVSGRMSINYKTGEMTDGRCDAELPSGDPKT